MCPCISISRFVHTVRPSVCLFLCLSVHEHLSKTAENSPKFAGKHNGFALIHIGCIYMPGQACCFLNSLKTFQKGGKKVKKQYDSSKGEFKRKGCFRFATNISYRVFFTIAYPAAKAFLLLLVYNFLCGFMASYGQHISTRSVHSVKNGAFFST